MHKPVLLKETIEYLNPQGGDTILDATIGSGGHAEIIMQKIGRTGTFVGIDQDMMMIDRLNSKYQITNNKFILVNENFRNLDKVLDSLKIEKIDGVIFDLGMSTMQLEESGRGFSFQRNESLVMNYKSNLESSDLTAQDILNKWSEKDIADILYKYGEERYSRKIAKRIIETRERKEIKNTFDLVEIIRLSVPPAYRNNRKINCCTRTFQALRIAVNDELDTLEEGLEKAWGFLSSNARMAVISFHSLEDRIVKNFIRSKKEKDEGIILTKKPIRPQEEEIKINPASRSAKLRAVEKNNL